jgi:hypothetical protein
VLHDTRRQNSSTHPGKSKISVFFRGWLPPEKSQWIKITTNPWIFRLGTKLHGKIICRSLRISSVQGVPPRPHPKIVWRSPRSYGLLDWPHFFGGVPKKGGGTPPKTTKPLETPFFDVLSELAEFDQIWVFWPFFWVWPPLFRPPPIHLCGFSKSTISACNPRKSVLPTQAAYRNKGSGI